MRGGNSETHINNVDAAKHLEFRATGCDNGELRGVTKCRLPVGMAVDLIKSWKKKEAICV